MITLILFSLAMLVGCYLAGCVPLAFELSERKIRMITIFGAGLLIGTALAVIIPEGVESMYHSHEMSAQEQSILAHPLAQPMRKLTQFNQQVPGVVKIPDDTSGKKVDKMDAKSADKSEDVHHHHEEESSESHKYIGISLVSGFILMLIIDHQFSSKGHTHGSTNSGGLGRGGLVSMDLSSPGDNIPGVSMKTSMTATVGLVVHAVADGIALGAASGIKQLHVEAIVFMAIMLHKGPAAFALVSYLLHEGIDRSRIRKHLFIFSVAAPLGAILTYMFLMTFHSFPLASYPKVIQNATGVALLFSAGTFLYVATIHVLADLSPTRFRWGELLLWILGACLPLLLSFGHSH